MRMNATGVTSPDDVKGTSEPEEGSYHVGVKSIDEFPEKTPNAIFFNLEIFKGTVPGQEGKEYRWALFLEDNGDPSPAMLKAAMVMGLIQPGVEADVDWQKAENAQFVIKFAKVETGKGDNKKVRLRVADYNLAIWPLSHKDVATVPKDRAAFDIWKATKDKPAQQQQTTQQPAGAAAGASSGGDDWSDV